MKCSILHESRGRMRVHLHCGRMSLHQADVLEYYLKNVPDVLDVTVYDRTQDAVVRYNGSRSAVVAALAAFAFARAEAMDLVPDHTSRALNREFEEKLTMTVCRRAFSKLFLPLPVMAAIAAVKSLKYIKEGLSALLHGKLSVAVLDATAVTVSMVRGISIPPVCHVHAPAGRDSGGVDTQKIRSRSGRGHVLAGGVRVDAVGWSRGGWCPWGRCRLGTGSLSAPAA